MTKAWRRHIAGLHLAGLVLWALVACSGSVWLASTRLQQLHAAFETDARIVHRLLSQRVVQHDAVMSTLALLQPTAAPAQYSARTAARMSFATRTGTGRNAPSISAMLCPTISGMVERTT